jgi:hypothetical protein
VESPEQPGAPGNRIDYRCSRNRDWQAGIGTTVGLFCPDLGGDLQIPPLESVGFGPIAFVFILRAADLGGFPS